MASYATQRASVLPLASLSISLSDFCGLGSFASHPVSCFDHRLWSIVSLLISLHRFQLVGLSRHRSGASESIADLQVSRFASDVASPISMLAGQSLRVQVRVSIARAVFGSRLPI